MHSTVESQISELLIVGARALFKQELFCMKKCTTLSSLKLMSSASWACEPCSSRSSFVYMQTALDCDQMFLLVIVDLLTLADCEPVEKNFILYAGAASSSTTINFDNPAFRMGRKLWSLQVGVISGIVMAAT